jgi:hypothetical protein
MHDGDMTPSRNPEGLKSAVKLWETRKFKMGFRIADRAITSLHVSLKIHGDSKHPGEDQHRGGRGTSSVVTTQRR